MQQLQDQRKFCEARELITDNEVHRLTHKYHNRHPTFSIDLQERTCKTVVFSCIYHYRHIEVDLQCQCIYNDILHKFQYNWSTDNTEYKKILEEIFLRLNLSSTNRSVDDQMESIMEQLTKYFTQLKPIQEEEPQQQQSTIRKTRKNSTSSSSSPIEIVKYDQSPQRRRRVLLERSLSWSQPLTSHPIRNKPNSISVERKKKS